MTCYCCTCRYDINDNLVGWDPSCRNHGAHGLRACVKHGLKAEDCNCGCGHKTDGQRIAEVKE